MIPPLEGIERLRRGNFRYVSGKSGKAVIDNLARRQELVEGQSPFAIILGCSDSRVPVETIFDQNPGDLFVIRVAGNFAGTTQIGSIEYAIEVLGVRLVVVLGHSGCGAIQTTLAEIEHPSQNLSPGLQSIVSAIQPAIDLLPAKGTDHAIYVEKAVHANVRYTVNQLDERSAIVYKKAREGNFKVVGAVYSIGTGEVVFI